MSTAALVSVEEYISTNYEPDVDYDEGRLIERNLGRFKHARLQCLIGAYITNHEFEWRILGLTEQHIRVAQKKFCIADVCAIRHDEPHQDILDYPPLFTIEILSEHDTFAEVEEKGRKYLNMGVPYVWTVDPECGRCYRHSPDGILMLTDGALRIENSSVAIPIVELMTRLSASQL